MNLFVTEAGTSPNPCSEIYPGPHPFSEYESRSLAEFVKGLDVKLYISFHSYGQYLMYPYGHTTEASWNDAHLVGSNSNRNDCLIFSNVWFIPWQSQIAQKTIDAIAVRYNTSYVQGTVSNAICKLYQRVTIYTMFQAHCNKLWSHCVIIAVDKAAGGSIDWVYAVRNVSLSYVFEFRDHRDGKMTKPWIIFNSVQLLSLFIQLSFQVITDLCFRPIKSYQIVSSFWMAWKLSLPNHVHWNTSNDMKLIKSSGRIEWQKKKQYFIKCSWAFAVIEKKKGWTVLSCCYACNKVFTVKLTHILLILFNL